MSTLRPADLAREHGISTQAVRNYERDGFLPPAERTPSGYRVYTARHAAALRAYLALVPAYGHASAAAIMTSIHAGRLDRALAAVDDGHAALMRDRATLQQVGDAIGHLAAAASSTPERFPAAMSIGELARRLRVVPATLRTWERAGILAPARDPATEYRVYGAGDVRDAELAHLLRRGGYPLEQIAAVVRQVREAGGTRELVAALEDWERRLVDRGLAMLTASGRLGEYLACAGGGA